MTTFRFSDEATSTSIEARDIHTAAASYLRDYDTADQGAGEKSEARIFDFAGRCGILTIEADGNGGVEGWEVAQ